MYADVRRPEWVNLSVLKKLASLHSPRRNGANNYCGTGITFISDLLVVKVRIKGPNVTRHEPWPIGRGWTGSRRALDTVNNRFETNTQLHQLSHEPRRPKVDPCTLMDFPIVGSVCGRRAVLQTGRAKMMHFAANLRNIREVRGTGKVAGPFDLGSNVSWGVTWSDQWRGGEVEV